MRQEKEPGPPSLSRVADGALGLVAAGVVGASAGGRSWRGSLVVGVVLGAGTGSSSSLRAAA
jgi:hypothetical protein